MFISIIHKSFTSVLLSATFLFSKFDIAFINISFKINGKRIPDKCVTTHDIDKNIQFGLSSWQKKDTMQ